MKVLLINGTERTPPALKAAIEQNGHEIIEAAERRDAAMKIRADRPDLVLLAGRLSDSDRSFLTAELKKDPASIEIPIVSCYIEADSVDSLEPGTGTAVMIYLPLAAHPGNTAGTGNEYPLMTGSETVLLAEDQAELRVVTSALIKEFGYTVIEAKDGREAVELFKRHKGEVRLIILDLIMPEMCGVSAYYEISRADPSVEVIFMSGYPGESQPEEGPDGKRLNFVRKPFMPGELLSLMRTLLDKPVKAAEI